MFRPGQYVITCTTSDTKWHGTNARSLLGAKMCASRMYSPSADARLRVGIARDEYSVDDVALKHGYSPWKNA